MLELDRSAQHLTDCFSEYLFGKAERRRAVVVIEGDFVGPDEDVKDSKNKIKYKSLLGSDDLEKIISVYGWIIEKNIRLFRVNLKSKQEDERIAWFGRKFDWIYLNCCRLPSIALSALGVRVGKTRMNSH